VPLLMESAAGPDRIEIEINEWEAAQERIEGVLVQVTWRGARDDPNVAALLAALPSSIVVIPGFPDTSLRTLVPIKLLDGRTELAPESWKHLRFGKGRPIYEAARKNFEAWSGGGSFLEGARKSEVGRMTRRLVPGFDDYPVTDQIDFMKRTVKKVETIERSIGDLINHLEYAKPDTAKAARPLKEPTGMVRAAVFSDMLNSTRRAGELLEVPVPRKDQDRHENQTVRKRAKLGRVLLHDYYGKSKYEEMIDRMRRYHRWWKRFDVIEDPTEQMYVLLAEARGTSADHEKRLASEDGFGEKLDAWVAVVERRLKADETYQRSEDPAEEEGARQAANQLWSQQQAIQQTDVRFEMALSLAELKAPPPSVA
jgi:hypothetical protein